VARGCGGGAAGLAERSLNAEKTQGTPEALRRPPRTRADLQRPPHARDAPKGSEEAPKAA
jgi:hypothetical protein